MIEYPNTVHILGRWFFILSIYFWEIYPFKKNLQRTCIVLSNNIRKIQKQIILIWSNEKPFPTLFLLKRFHWKRKINWKSISIFPYLRCNFCELQINLPQIQYPNDVKLVRHFAAMHSSRYSIRTCLLSVWLSLCAQTNTRTCNRRNNISM